MGGISALRYTTGSSEQRVQMLAEQFDLHPRHIRTAIDYAAVHRDDIDAQVARNDDAVHVRNRGVDARPDAEVVAVAAAEQRVIVTNNVKDFAGVHGVTVLCVLKSRLPPQGMHVHLAELLDTWAMAHPEPYLGLHWLP